MRVDSTGNVAWAIKAGDSSNDIGYGIASDGAGGALVTGAFQGTATFGSSITLTSSGFSDAFVMRVDSTGNVTWAIKAGGSSNDIGYGIASDGAGGALVTGAFQARPRLARPSRSRAAAGQ